MVERLDPKVFGISSRAVIEKRGLISYVIVINRKSRIIMADGKKISTMAEKIKATVGKAEIILESSAPICSKTMRYLEGLSINIL